MFRVNVGLSQVNWKVIPQFASLVLA